MLLFILTPMILWWVVACGYPLVYGIFLGFFEMYDVTQDPVFIGLANFKNFFTDVSYLKELWNTVWIGFASTILINIAGLLVAVALNSVKKLKGFYRSVWYIPAVTSSVAITQIFGIIFDPVTGIVNQILTSRGLDAVSLDSNYGLAVAVILLYTVWKSAGSSAIVWLAGLQSIDKRLYEAASLDGASKWKKFTSVTLPSLKPIAVYIIITGIIDDIKPIDIFSIDSVYAYGMKLLLIERMKKFDMENGKSSYHMIYDTILGENK